MFPQIVRVSEALLTDHDDMVQKGLGWLLREAAKADPKTAVPYLLHIRKRAPRLVLRTACETLTAATRARALSRKATRTRRKPVGELRAALRSALQYELGQKTDLRVTAIPKPSKGRI